MIDLCAQKECVTVKVLIHQYMYKILSSHFHTQYSFSSHYTRIWPFHRIDINIILWLTLFIFINPMNTIVTISVLICVAWRKDIFYFIARLNKLYCLQKVWKGFWAVSLNFFQPYLQTTMKAESFVLGFSHEINLDC